MKRRHWIPILFFVLVVGGALTAWQTYPWSNINPDFIFRIMALSESYSLDADAKREAVALVQEVLESPDETEYARGHGASLEDADSRPVWVSLYLPGEKMARGRGASSSVRASLIDATRQAWSAVRTRSAWRNGRHRAAIQIDILRDQAKLHLKSAGYLFFAVEPGVDGLRVRRGDRRYEQLPSDAVTMGYLTPRVKGRVACVTTLLEEACRSLGTRRRGWIEDPDVEVERFRTLSFGRPVPGGDVLDFYRGNVLLTKDDVTAKRIYRSIQEGARWLLNNARPDGKFNYEYFPNTDRYSKSYNAVRHAGTLYGLFELYRNFQEPSFLAAAEKGLPYLYKNIRRPGRERGLLALPDGRSWPTGAAALGLLAFIHMPPDIRPEDYRRYEEGLGEFLLRMIDERGWVFEGYLAYKGADKVVKEPLYYPGEAMLALSLLYHQTGEDRWLEGAEHIAERQIRKFYRTRSADHWVIQGLYQLYLATKEDFYAEACLSMADSYIRTQYPPNHNPFPDYFGAYRRETETPRTTRAGSRSEAMTAAVRTAWAFGVDPRVYEDSLLFAAKHQMEQQFRPENAFFLPRPQRALGGFRAGLIDNHLRIDFNQHSSVGLIGALEVAVKRSGETPWWTPQPIYPPDLNKKPVQARHAVEDLPTPPPTRGTPSAEP